MLCAKTNNLINILQKNKDYWMNFKITSILVC